MPSVVIGTGVSYGRGPRFGQLRWNPTFYVNPSRSETLVIGAQASIPALASWSGIGGRATVVSVDGSIYRITATGGVGTHVANAAIVGQVTTLGAEFTVDLKAETTSASRSVKLYVGNGYSDFNLDTGEATNASGLATAPVSLGDGWWRLSTVRDLPTIGAYCQVHAYDAAGTSTTFDSATVDSRTLIRLPNGTASFVQRRVRTIGDVRGAGVPYLWEQATEAAQPGLRQDAQGWFLEFGGAQRMRSDSITSLLSGTSVPYSIAAAIGGVTRNATAATLWSMASAIANEYITCSPNLNATTSRSTRIDAGGTDTLDAATTATYGTLLQYYDGTTQSLQLGAVVASAAMSGAFAPTISALGALSYNSTPTVAQPFFGRIYEFGVYAKSIDGIAASMKADIDRRFGF